MCINPLQPSNSLRTTRFKIQNFHVLTRRRIHVFVPFSGGRGQVFINKTVYVNFAVQIEFLKIFQDNFHLKSFPQSNSVVRCPYQSTNAPYASASTRCSCQKEKRAKPANQPTKKHLRESGSIGEKSTLTILRLKVCAMTEVVSRRSLTTEARLRSQLIPCEIYGKQSGTRTGFSPSTWVLSCQYHSTNARHLSPARCCSYLQDKRAKTANIQKAMPRRNREALETYVFSICV